MAWDYFLTGDDGPPKHVTHAQWDKANLFLISSGFMLLSGFIGLAFFVFINPVDSLEKAKKMTVAKIQTYQGELVDAVVTGLLKTPSPKSMPDGNQIVIYGDIQLYIKDASDRMPEKNENNQFNKPAPERLTKTLFAWNYMANTLYLEDKNQKLKITLDQTHLPTKVDSHRELTLDHTGTKSFRKLTGVEYNNRHYDVDLDSLGWEKAYAHIERSFFENNQIVTVLCSIQNGEITKVETVYQGTLEQTKKDLSFSHNMILILLLIIGVGGSLLYRKAKQFKLKLIAGDPTFSVR